MKIAATCDLHWGHTRDGDASTRELAWRLERNPPDVLMVAGDIAGVDKALFRAGLDVFRKLDALKLLVLGNHDLWVTEGGSMGLLERLPALAREAGFQALEEGPVTEGGVAFAGNVGWYDYSFRDESLHVPMECYERKRLPGVCGWNDGAFVRLGMSDPEFTEMLLERFKRDLARAADQAERVVCVLHHLPREEFRIRKKETAWDFCNAFMGSGVFGKAVLECPKVKLCVFGHTHVPDRRILDGVEWVNPGSSYWEKRLVELEV